MLVLSMRLHCGTYGEASGQWSSCHAGLNKEAKTGSDRGLIAMLCVCVCPCEVCMDISESVDLGSAVTDFIFHLLAVLLFTLKENCLNVHLHD